MRARARGARRPRDRRRQPAPRASRSTPTLHDRVLTEALAAAAREGDPRQGRHAVPARPLPPRDGGARLEANVRLVLRNAALAAQIARAASGMTPDRRRRRRHDRRRRRARGPLAHGSDTPARSWAAAAARAPTSRRGWPRSARRSLIGRVGDDPPGRARGRRAAGGRRRGAAGGRPRAADRHLRRARRARRRAHDAARPGRQRRAGRRARRCSAAPHLHVAGYALLRDGLARRARWRAIERARAAGMTVSVDPSSWALIRPGAIPDVDLLLPNEREAEVLGERARWSSSSAPTARAGATSTSRPSRSRSSTPPGPATRSPPGCSPPAWTAPTRRPRSKAGCAAAARVVSQVGARPS